MQNKTVLASVAALALVVSGVVFAPSSKAAPSPNIAKSDTQWHDGLNHFILTPAAAAEALAQNPTPAPIPAPVETTTTTSTTVDAAHPKQIPPDAIESKSPQGKIIWILKDGSLVDENGNPITETDTPEATEPPESEPAHATAEPKPAVGGEIGIVASRTFADTVREWTGVNSVEPMNNGLVAIATTLTKSELEKRPELSRVDNNQLLEMSSVANGSPNDPLYTQEWMLRNTGNSSQTSGATSGTTGADTHAPSAWAKATGQGVVVADVDSGVDIAHQDLTNQIWHNSHETCGNGIDDDHNGYVDDCNGYDFGVGDNNPSPDVSGSFGSHGTHVAGIIGAQSDNNTGIAGMAPNARIMPVKIASGSQLQTAAIYSAIMYAVDNGAKIINASWGTGPDTARSSAYVMEQAVQYAQTHGVLFVVAAGNDAVNIDQHQSWPASFSLYYNNVLTVGASTNADSIASFSNFGAASVSLFAPGWFIESTLPGNSYGMMSGTSMASPCAAGAAALLLERQPTFTPVQLINQMKSSVDSIPSLYGYSQSSRLNAATAVGAASDPFSVDYKNFSVALPDTPFAGIATLHLNDPTLVTGTTKVRASVITPEQGYVYAVSGMPIGSGTGSALTNTITDDNGQASLLTLSSANVTAAASSAGLPLTLGIQLPTGDYGLMLQLTDSTDHVLMNGSAVYFSVSLQNTPTTTTTIAGGSGSSTTSTTAASSPSTTAAPSGTTTTTTAAPGHGGTTTTTHAPSGGSGGGSGATTTTTAASGGGSGGGSSGGGSGGGSSGGGSGGGSPATTAPPGSGSGGGGGSTVTTTPAGGGSGGGGSPATTAPPGGGSGGGGSTPADPGTPVSPSTTIPSNGDPTPAPVTSNGWTFASRYPSSGSDVGGTMVMLSGVFPDYSHATVKMGGNTATVFYATPSSIWLITPAHSAGLTDITITAPSVTLAMPSAFRYLSTSGSSGGGSGGSSGGSGSGSSGTTTTTVAGGSGGSSGGSSGGATTTTVVPPAWRGNLKLVRLPSSNTWGSFSSTAWPARDCKTTTCAGVAVR